MTLLAQAGQRGARGVRQPAGRRDQLGQGRAELALDQAQHQRRLRLARRLGNLRLGRCRMWRLRLDADRGEPGGGDVAAVAQIALDPSDLAGDAGLALDQQVQREQRRDRFDGARAGAVQPLGKRVEAAAVALRSMREQQGLGVGELGHRVVSSARRAAPRRSHQPQPRRAASRGGSAQPRRSAESAHTCSLWCRQQSSGI